MNSYIWSDEFNLFVRIKRNYILKITSSAATNPHHESSNLSIRDHRPRHDDASKSLGMEIPKNPEIDFEQAVQGRTFYSINSSPSLGDLYRSFSTVNCQNIICLAGGVCTEIGDSSGKCLCQMGTTGKYCEQGEYFYEDV